MTTPTSTPNRSGVRTPRSGSDGNRSGTASNRNRNDTADFGCCDDDLGGDGRYGWTIEEAVRDGTCEFRTNPCKGLAAMSNEATKKAGVLPGEAMSLLLMMIKCLR